MQILLIDNNDSFTYNIVDLLRKFQSMSLDVVKSSAINIEEIECYDKIILSPGPGLPKDFPILDQVIETYKNTKPILGICLGHQAICTHFGAKMSQLPEVCHGKQLKINVDNKNSILYQGLANEIKTGLYHSWYIHKDELPKSLICSGIHNSNVIMSVQHESYDIHGVQYHPESFLTEEGAHIIANFLNH